MHASASTRSRNFGNGIFSIELQAAAVHRTTRVPRGASRDRSPLLDTPDDLSLFGKVRHRDHQRLEGAKGYCFLRTAAGDIIGPPAPLWTI